MSWLIYIKSHYSFSRNLYCSTFLYASCILFDVNHPTVTPTEDAGSVSTYLFHSFALLFEAEFSASDPQALAVHHRASLGVRLQYLGQSFSLQQMTLHQLFLLLSTHVLYLVQLLFTSFIKYIRITGLAVRRNGSVVNCINKVTLHRAWSVLGRVTIFGWYVISQVGQLSLASFQGH